MLPRLRNAHVTVVALVCAVILTPARGEEPKQKSVPKVYSVCDLVVPIKDCNITGLPFPGPIACIDSCACDLEPTVSEILACDFDFMCQQPEEPPCCQAGKCCPNGACCPNGSCCKKADCCKPAASPAPTTESNAQGLLQLIRSTVCPKCWKEAGGTCTIEYCAQSMGLVICAPPDVQERVADVLDSMHKLLYTEIAVEVRLVTVNDETYQRLGLDFAKFLDDRQVTRLMDALQSDRHTNVMQAPKLTLFNGQNAGIQIADQQFFVTGVKTTLVKGALCPVSQNEAISLGLQTAIRATLSADHKFVRCDLAVENKELAGDVPLFPVTTFVTPIFEGGAQGQPVPFTQFIQQPTVIKRGVSKSLMIPDGGTAVLYAGKCEKPEPDADDGPCAPLFDWIYDIVDLFSPPEPPPTYEEHLLVLVTPRVIVEHGEMVEAQPMPMGPKEPGVSDPIFGVGNCSGSLTSDLDIPCCPKPMSQPAPIVRQCAAMADAPSCPAPAPAVVPCPVMSCPAAPPGPEATAQQVQLDVCILCMDPAAWDRPVTAAWADLSPKACEGQPKFISPDEMARFCTSMKAMQAGKCPAAPRITTLNGQTAAFESKMPPNTDISLNILPIINSDCIDLELNCLIEANPRNVWLEYRSSKFKATAAAGRTVLMHCGQDAEDRDVIVMVTPHVFNDTAVAVLPSPMATGCPMPPCLPSPMPMMTCAAVAAPSLCEPRLNRMMAKYRQACADGEKEKAAAYADCCLMIDPTCFAK